MPIEPPLIGICVGGELNGMRVYDMSDVIACRSSGGEVTPASSAPPPRVMQSLFTEHVSSPDEPSENSTEANILYFPLCNMHRRFPDSPIARTLDELDVDATRDLTRILKEDNQLRSRVLRFVLDVTYVVAKATALEPTAGATPAPPIPADLIANGRELGDILASRVSDQNVADTFAQLIDKSLQLDGTNVLDVIRILSTDHPTAAS
ncbi:hypothetical protein [Mycobacterium sp. RTGN5]|uniref:hypothetical protein n=1 Tax=Mycobacterium sp. RTGN5 TaxID=3016522 RepID=UPI0029C9A64D|nr:hypothetical protein [Mycobacterium sp. RTGN5]